jgi:hypothetical protein
MPDTASSTAPSRNAKQAVAVIDNSIIIIMIMIIIVIV